ncbi:Hydrophobin [Pleurotus pulmonarius]
MLFRISSSFIALVAFTAFTAAQSPAVSQCSTGSIQCCGSVVAVDSPSAKFLLGLLGIVLGPMNGSIGLECSPISVIGSGNVCTASAVCCQNTGVGGLLAIGCTPVIS